MHIKSGLFTIGSAVLLLEGCQKIEKNFAPTVSTPWQPIHTTTLHNEFITKKALLSGKYSLIDLVEIGLQQNPQTKCAWWQAKEAFAHQGQANAKFFPSIDASVSVNRSQEGKAGTTNTKRSDYWGPALSLSYQIFNFGADVASAKSATHLLYAANYEFNQTLQSVVFQIQQAFYEFSSACAKIEARESCLRDAELSFEAVSKKKANGLACIQDQLLAQADKLQAEYELEESKSYLESCRANLATAIGIPISTDFSIETDYLNSKTQSILSNAEELMASTLKSRADLLANEEKLAASRWAQKATQRANLPSLVFNTKANLLKHRTLSSWQRNYDLSLGMQWNIFSGFEQQYNELASYTQVKEQKYALRQKKLETLEQTWSAFHSFRSSIQLLTAAETLEKASSEALEAIRIGYNSGVNSLLDLLSAQKTLSNARLSHIQAQTNVKLSLVKLAYVTGQLDVEQANVFNL